MTASYAEAPKESPTPEMSPEQNKRMDDYVENWNKNVRNKNHYYIAGQVGAINGQSFLGTGIKAGYRLNDLGIELQYNSNPPFSNVQSGQIKDSRFTLDAKYFVTDTFFLASGIGYEIFSIKETESVIDGEDGRYTKYSSGIFEFFIGNQWEFNHITVGGDWLGVIFVTQPHLETYHPYARKPNQGNDMPANWSISSGILSRIFVGYSF